MKNETFTKYAQLESQIQALEEEKEAIKLDVIAEMEAEGLSTFKIIQGTFSMQERKTWEYSGVVQEEKERLDELKKQEEADGTAQAKVARSLRFQLAK